MRRVGLAAALLVLAACAHQPRPRPNRAEPTTTGTASADVERQTPPACRQTREHRDSDYTPGGLYAPGVADSAPQDALDISGLAEPVPQDEPRSAYGNPSSYKVLGRTYHVRTRAQGYRERGTASWYGQKFQGRMTSSREPYDMCGFSAAHKTLPLPSYVRVTNLENGRSVVVRVNDRGPFHEGRIIDLSYAAAIRIGLDRSGTAPVEVVALTPGEAGRESLAQAKTPLPPPPPPPRPLPWPQAAAESPSQVLQVASFGEYANAERAAARLRAAGIDGVVLTPADVDGRRLWRVRIEPLLASAADALFDQVRALGFAPRLLPR